jgi:threonine synthase
VIGQCGIGCEPASAATLAGIRNLVTNGGMESGADVVAVLTGNILKDSDYAYQYHTGSLRSASGVKILSNLGNQPVLVPYDLDAIATFLDT